jgi:hypothetical protein
MRLIHPIGGQTAAQQKADLRPKLFLKVQTETSDIADLITDHLMKLDIDQIVEL